MLSINRIIGANVGKVTEVYTKLITTSLLMRKCKKSDTLS